MNHTAGRAQATSWPEEQPLPALPCRGTGELGGHSGLEAPSLRPSLQLDSKASVLVQPLLLMSSAAPGGQQMEAVYGFTR